MSPLTQRGWRTTALATSIMALAVASPAVAIDAPAVLRPADGAAVNQATDAIALAPHDGSVLRGIYVSASPLTREQKFGGPPGSDPELAEPIGVILETGGNGATRIPLSGLRAGGTNLVLPPGTYYYRFLWTGSEPGYEVCIVANTVMCPPEWVVFSPPMPVLKWSPVHSFSIPAPPPPPPPPAPPSSPDPSTDQPSETVSAACRLMKTRYVSAQRVVRQRMLAVHHAKSAKARRVATVRLRKAVRARSDAKIRVAFNCAR